jgi:L-ascorbate metabolism protein UlaG (beta-lactamase superfamily)
VENRARFAPAGPVPAGHVALTFVNHATFLIRSDRLAILTDPVWSKRASPVQWIGPARVRHPGVPLDALPPIDLVLVSHNHYDHMDLTTLRALQRRHGCHIVTTLGNRAYLQRRGLGDVVELDWGHSHDIVTATPAQHFSARTPFDRNRTLWAGFAIALPSARIFFAGDSGYWTHFADIGRQLGPFDVSLVPIGAYEPRWFMSAAHMNPEEAVQAHLDLRSRLSIGMHFGCFQLTDEAIDDPLRALEAARAAHGVDPAAFRVLEPGETLLVKETR